MKMQIKNILFDLGGVLLNIDYLQTVEAFKKLGLQNPEKAFTKEVQAEIFQRFEKGEISTQVFLQALRKKMPKASDDELINAWNALLGDFPRHRFDFLKELSGSYKLGVLSNTNSIHEKEFVKTIDKTVGWKEFTELFEGICYSHELGYRKPNSDIFKACLEKLSFNPAQTLFIDDTEEHVLGARNAGLVALHLASGEAEDLIKQYLKAP